MWGGRFRELGKVEMALSLSWTSRFMRGFGLSLIDWVVGLLGKEVNKEGGGEGGSCTKSTLAQWRSLKERRVHEYVILFQPHVFNEHDAAMPALSERLARAWCWYSATSVQGCRVQLSKERHPELLTNEKIEQSKNNETGIVKPGFSRSEDPEFMNVDEGFQLLNTSLTLIAATLDLRIPEERKGLHRLRHTAHHQETSRRSTYATPIRPHQSLTSLGVCHEYIMSSDVPVEARSINDMDTDLHLENVMCKAECSMVHEEVTALPLEMEKSRLNNPLDLTKLEVPTSQLCRVCATLSEALTPIFGKKSKEMELVKKIHTHLPILVNENDVLPVNVCDPCVEKLQICHDLVTTCSESDVKLRQMMGLPVEKDMPEMEAVNVDVIGKEEPLCDKPLREDKVNESESEEEEDERDNDSDWEDQQPSDPPSPAPSEPKRKRGVTKGRKRKINISAKLKQPAESTMDVRKSSAYKYVIYKITAIRQRSHQRLGNWLIAAILIPMSR
uniref:ZAD domain-containing protein n=1 Tax=Timema douglasi TaxID=61478 RepID=A0A7R8VDQ2_TIMDO|nr:unnamed protein product [Timema douglasi]